MLVKFCGAVYRRWSSVNFGEIGHFCPKNMYEKLTIPKFYMTFAREMPEFYVIIARKILFLDFFWGGGARAPLVPSPIYAYFAIENFVVL